MNTRGDAKIHYGKKRTRQDTRPTITVTDCGNTKTQYVHTPQEVIVGVSLANCLLFQFLLPNTKNTCIKRKEIRHSGLLFPESIFLFHLVVMLLLHAVAITLHLYLLFIYLASSMAFNMASAKVALGSASPAGSSSFSLMRTALTTPLST